MISPSRVPRDTLGSESGSRFLFMINWYCIFLPGIAILAEEASVPTSGVCRDGLLWSYSDGVLTISGEGKMAHYAEQRGPWDGIYTYYFPKPWAEFSCDIVKIVFEGEIENVGGDAFIDCVNLEEVALGKVREIHSNAFSGTKLNKIENADKLMYIANSAINRTPLSENNSSIILGNKLLWIKDEASGVYIVPDGIKALGDRLFASDDITGIVLPESLEIIGNYCFNYCKLLTDIKLPEGLIYW